MTAGKYDEHKKNIILMHEAMEELTTTLVGVDQKRYRSVILDLEEFSDGEVVELYDWLKNLYENEYKQLKYVWTLLSPEMWDRYTIFKIYGTREQKMLKEAKKNLRLIWDTKIYRTAKQLERIKQKKSPTKHKDFS